MGRKKTKFSKCKNLDYIDLSLSGNESEAELQLIHLVEGREKEQKRKKRLRSEKNRKYMLKSMNLSRYPLFSASNSALNLPHTVNDVLGVTKHQEPREIYLDSSLVGESFSDEDYQSEGDLDTEMCLCSLSTTIVGCQYYAGTVNTDEMVSLHREPNNKYDHNAIKVTNIIGEQVGHIKKQLARPLSYLMDSDLARVEGVVPYESSNMYTVPLTISVWGSQAKQAEVVAHLRQHKLRLSGVPKKMKSSKSSRKMLDEPYDPNRTLLDGNIKDHLNEVFGAIKEGDKTTEMLPSTAIRTKLFPHQKQALNWLVKKEIGADLPPFWVKQSDGRYFNAVANFGSVKRPDSVMGGILADDMGLGKTLTMIALIVTHFQGGNPLALRVPGTIRKTRVCSTIERPTLENSTVASSLSLSVGRKPNSKTKLSSIGFTNVTDSEMSCSDSTDNEIDNEISLLSNSKEDPDYLPKVSDSSACVKRLPHKPRRTASTKRKYFSEDDSCEDVVHIGSVTLKNKSNRKPAKKKSKSSIKSSANNISNIDLVDITSPVKENICPVDKPLPESSHSVSNSAFVTSCVDLNVSVIPHSSSSLTNEKTNLIKRHPTQPFSNEVTTVETLSRDQAHLSSTVSGSTIKQNLPTLPQLSALDSDSELPDLVAREETSRSSAGTVSGRIVDSSFALNPYEFTGRTLSQGERRATLIVAPLSLLYHWQEQLDTHLTEDVHLAIYTCYGAGRNQSAEFLSKHDIVLTTYHTVAASSKKADSPFRNVKWLRLVLDEGHFIRNPYSLMSKSIYELDSERRWVVTGTPIQNSLKDLWSLLHFLRVKPLDDRFFWNRIILRPLRQKQEQVLKHRLQSLMGAISLRRMKTTEVNNKRIVSLPEKKVFIEHIKFSEEEKELYETMRNEGRLVVSKFFRLGTLLNNYSQVLTILVKLRQLCCHPCLVSKAAAATIADIAEVPADSNEDQARKTLIDKLLEVIGSATAEECSICLDTLESPVITQCAHLFCRHCIEQVIDATRARDQPHCPLCRSVVEKDDLVEPPPVREPEINTGTLISSSKVEALMRALIHQRSDNPTYKSVVVSQFTSFLTVLEEPLKANGFKFTRLDGTMSANKRKEAVESFSDEGPFGPTVLLLSLTAGGVGLNLVAASRLYLMDPSWNPAAEDQCFDRLHRLGQTRDVVITKFIVTDSVEEQMITLQEKKRKLMATAFGKKTSTEDKRKQRIEDIKLLMDI